MIDLNGVSRRYGSVQALSDVSFHVEKGHIVGLLGQNGAGKTTLLKILTGYLAPSGGSVSICGFDPLYQAQQARRKIGYLPENPPLHDEMTAEEYLHFVSELRGVVRQSIPTHVEEILSLCGITDMRKRLLGNLSKGYRQRVGFAQALCGSPEVIILDEPTVGLDPKQVTEIRSLIRKLGREHTILFSSHILSEVQQLCDQVVILERGRLCLDTSLRKDGEKDRLLLRCILEKANEQTLRQIRGLPGLVSLEVLEKADDRTKLLLTYRGEDEPEKALFYLLSRLSVPILQLDRVESGLEELFLQAISQ